MGGRQNTEKLAQPPGLEKIPQHASKDHLDLALDAWARLHQPQVNPSEESCHTNDAAGDARLPLSREDRHFASQTPHDQASEGVGLDVLGLPDPLA